MPLRVMDVVDQRLRMVVEVQAGVSPRVVAGLHGVSKSQLYVWLGRYEAAGAEGLVPRSHRPWRSPLQLPAEVEDMIVAWRKDRPRWGAKKIRAKLAEARVDPLPAVSTIHQVLRRRGLVRPVERRGRLPGGGHRFVREHPNDLWHIDATQHRLANGRAYWVIDLLDDHSRFLLGAYVCPAPTAEASWAALREAVGRYGLPRQLLSDNGLNFTGRLHGLTVAFERQVRAAGIGFIHTSPRHPQCNGKHERQHGEQNAWLAEDLFRLGRPTSLTAAQTRVDAYRADYNTARPHEGIGQRYPAQLYRPEQPVELPAVELAPADPYPAGCLKRRVNASGQVAYARHRWPLDSRWTGITVGLLRHGATLEIYYGAALIDTLIIGDHPAPTPRGRKPSPTQTTHRSTRLPPSPPTLAPSSPGSRPSPDGRAYGPALTPAAGEAPPQQPGAGTNPPNRTGLPST